ncbi:BURP domain-containing protein BNM2C-like [Hevea brasiliensis]|nr:BURP domain-containing protein BNM2C-like [Hevea brasiliensis]
MSKPDFQVDKDIDEPRRKMVQRFAYCILFFNLLFFMCAHGSRDEITDQELEKKKFSEAYSLQTTTMNIEKFSHQKFLSQIQRNTNEVIKNNSLQLYYKFLNEIIGKIPGWRHPRGSTEDSSAKTVSKCENFVIDYIEASYLGLFTLNSLYRGKIMPIYFPIDDYSSTFPPFMTKKIADSSTQKYSQQVCKLTPTDDQDLTTFCSTSLKSMLDYIRLAFKSEGGFKVIETTHYPSLSTALLQDYIITENLQEIGGSGKVFCHPMYRSFYCHFDDQLAKVFKISLAGENGDQVEAIAVCHMDTSGMGPDLIAFRLLPVKPGSPFCHFLPAGHLVWVHSPTIAYVS